MGLGTRAKKWISRLRGRSSKEEEVQQLRPVALAGASRKCSDRSTLCSSFTATVSTEELQSSFRRANRNKKALSDGALVPLGWTQCRTCARNFRALASKYKDFCSLDCKSLSLYHAASYS